MLRLDWTVNFRNGVNVQVDVGKLSMVMSQANLQTQVSFSVMGKVVDHAEVQNAELIKMLDQPVHPDLGHSIDVKA